MFVDYSLFHSFLIKEVVEVRGDPHEVFRPGEGGADQDQVFPCRRCRHRRRRVKNRQKSIMSRMIQNDLK